MKKGHARPASASFSVNTSPRSSAPVTPVAIGARNLRERQHLVATGYRATWV